MAIYTTQKTFAAPVERVFKAFTDSKAYGTWNCGTMYDDIVADLDPRVGGVIHHRVRAKRDGSLWTFFGVFQKIEENMALTYSFDWKQDWRDAPSPSLVEITFQPDGDKTLLEVKHSQVPETAVASTEAHWTNFLQALDGLVRK